MHIYICIVVPNHEKPESFVFHTLIKKNNTSDRIDMITKKIVQMEDPLNTYNNTSSTRINNNISLKQRPGALNNNNNNTNNGNHDQIRCCSCFKK